MRLPCCCSDMYRLFALQAKLLEAGMPLAFAERLHSICMLSRQHSKQELYLTALAGLFLAKTCLQYVTGAAHMTLVVKTPAATASSSATMSARSALGPEARRPPAMPETSRQI